MNVGFSYAGADAKQVAVSSAVAEYYAEPFGYTNGGVHHDALAALPAERNALAPILHQLLVHERLSDSFGPTLAQAAIAA